MIADVQAALPEMRCIFRLRDRPPMAEHDNILADG